MYTSGEITGLLSAAGWLVGGMRVYHVHVSTTLYQSHGGFFGRIFLVAVFFLVVDITIEYL